MRRLDFRVEYSVILFNFVDSLSAWDHFVSGHVRKYFNSYYGINSEELNYLEVYSGYRKKLGWDRETDLFGWAYAGFPDNGEFSELLEPIRYFEKKVNKKGVALKLELQEATNKLKSIVLDVTTSFNELAVEDNISLFARLFKSPDKAGSLPCYLTYSPDQQQTQGGSNGEGIYTEVVISSDEYSQVKAAVEVVAHEYIHKEVNPGRYFSNFPDHEIREIYHRTFPDIYPGKLYSFVEEVVVYTVNDVLLFAADALETKNYYAKRNENDMAIIWQAVSDLVPFLSDYHVGKMSSKETLDNIDRYFRSLVSVNSPHEVTM